MGAAQPLAQTGPKTNDRPTEEKEEMVDRSVRAQSRAKAQDWAGRQTDPREIFPAVCLCRPVRAWPIDWDSFMSHKPALDFQSEAGLMAHERNGALAPKTWLH